MKRMKTPWKVSQNLYTTQQIESTASINTQDQSHQPRREEFCVLSLWQKVVYQKQEHHPFCNKENGQMVRKKNSHCKSDSLVFTRY